MRRLPSLRIIRNGAYRPRAGWQEAPQRCPACHAFAGAWPYTTRDGGISSVIARYNAVEGAGKEFKPFTFCENAAGKCKWRSQALPEPRPIYNLDKLAARPDAPVLIVEGEKTADAAARIFPDYVLTTGSGGSNQFGEADWSPLAGRVVVIWPDNDGPGGKY